MMKKLQFFICTMAILLCSTALQAQVAVNTSGGNPHISAMLDVQSTSKGLLIPRLTTTARNTLAATALDGLMVYDTNLKKFFFFKNGAWAEGSVGGLWTRTGSNTYLTNTGDRVGIGNTNPDEELVIGINQGSGWAIPAATIGNTTGGVIMVGNGTNKASLEASNIFSFASRLTVSDEGGYGDGDLYMNLRRVGIGTGSPERTLEVSGNARNLRLTSPTGYSLVEFITSNTTDWGIGAGNGTLRMESSTNNFSGTTYQYMFGTTQFYPYINNTKDLGTTSYRWKGLYSYDGNFADDVTISDDLTVSGRASIGTSSVLGALQVHNPTTDNTALVITSRSINEDASLYFGESAANTNGMYWLYDGLSDELELWGKQSTTHYGPHMVVDRNTGSSTFTSTGNYFSAWFASDGSDATVVVGQDGTGPILKGFGPNGGEDEIRIENTGEILLYNGDHNRTISIDPQENSSGDAGAIKLYDATGTTVVIELDADLSGDGRIYTQELQITGGSDLSELFEIQEDEDVEPGMVLSIDIENPGTLKVSDRSYDARVAGIVSGANNISTGLIMSDRGTVADGEHLVALTGRVYCLVDADLGKIEAGDLLTTSSTPGYAMKVKNDRKARGAIIGKAMTSLKSGKGLVLVLVSLQ